MVIFYCQYGKCILILCRYIVICRNADLGAYVSICFTLATWKHQSASCQMATFSPWSSALRWWVLIQQNRTSSLVSLVPCPRWSRSGWLYHHLFPQDPETDFSATLCPCWVLALQWLLTLSLFSLASPLPHGREYRFRKAQLWSWCCLESKEARGGRHVNPDSLMTLKTVPGWLTSSRVWANFLAQCEIFFLPFSAQHSVTFPPSGQCLPPLQGEVSRWLFSDPHHVCVKPVPCLGAWPLSRSWCDQQRTGRGAEGWCQHRSLQTPRTPSFHASDCISPGAAVVIRAGAFLSTLMARPQPLKEHLSQQAQHRHWCIINSNIYRMYETMCKQKLNRGINRDYNENTYDTFY